MRKLNALNIKEVSHLCKLLGTDQQELTLILSKLGKFYFQQIKIVKGKRRHLASPKGRLKKILKTLNRYLQRLILPESIHGGLKGHSNISNAIPHISKSTVTKLDIKDFFSSVNNRMVYRAFIKLDCSPNVSRMLTSLTTLNGNLPQGSPTSTIVSALVATPMAKRISRLSDLHDASTTIYIDDITVSGTPRIKKFTNTYEKIIRQEGFSVNATKKEIIDQNKEQAVTGVRVNNGLDAPCEKIKSCRQSIEALSDTSIDVKRPSEKEINSIRGKINYIRKLNKGAGNSLHQRLNKQIQNLIPEGQL